MDLSPDLLLSILFVAIILNTALAVYLVANSRSRRHRREAAIEQTLAASSVVPAAPAVPAAEVPTATGAAGRSTPLEVEPVDDPGAAPAGRDDLTGLLDAPAFARLVALEESRVARYHRPATVVVFELDGLDRLAETVGRDAADRVVSAVADTVRRLARDADRAARLGPSRFGVLLAETDEVAAINYVERVRRACELWLEAAAIALRLGAGWAGTSGDPTLAEAQRVAIERLYAELRRGASRGEPATVDESGSTEPSTVASAPTRIAS